ncbi:hypothetical protein MPER_05271 [Moniliophthora perniciosa FA553]|nr:hypothetical protein MPER_05271 [Moniliophthora perniciosa FA553]
MASPPEEKNQDRTTALTEYEREDAQNRRPAFLLTFTEVKLLSIAGVGFFLDGMSYNLFPLDLEAPVNDLLAYDLFIINPVATMLQYRLYGGNSLPPNLEGFMKAGANIGSVIGQFLFVVFFFA